MSFLNYISHALQLTPLKWDFSVFRVMQPSQQSILITPKINLILLGHHSPSLPAWGPTGVAVGNH